MHRETYTPTLAERANTLAYGEFLKLSGDGVFATLQGEGVTAGAPAVFLRLQNCNLACGSGDTGWKCDAWYTWDRTTPEYWQETSNVEVESVGQLVRSAWVSSFAGETQPRLIVTGGEPLLQQRQVVELLRQLPQWQIEIETNGTIFPDPQLRDCQINCSPKLASSGNAARARYRPDVLASIAQFPNHWFKFVIASDEDIREVQAIVQAVGIQAQRVLLMPEGTDAANLSRRSPAVAAYAQALGFLVTERNHIYWYGDKRAT